MALKINKEIQFTSGATSSETLVFFNLQFLDKLNQVTSSFFLNEDAFKTGRDQVVPLDESLLAVSSVNMDIPKGVFWGPELMDKIHEKMKMEFEKLLGDNTVEIVKDPYS